MNEKDLAHACNPPLHAAMEALRRSAKPARRDAIRNQTDLVISEGGRIVSLSPQELESQLQGQREMQGVREHSGTYVTGANDKPNT